MKRILIVDDEKDAADVLAVGLKLSRFDVSIVHTGQEALTQADQDPPDLIILDIMMPGMSGSEVAELLKKNQKTATIPVIFLSALLSKQEETWKGNPPNVIFAKPYDLSILVDKIREMLA